MTASGRFSRPGYVVSVGKGHRGANPVRFIAFGIFSNMTRLLGAEQYAGADGPHFSWLWS